jgi:hypothetical protein
MDIQQAKQNIFNYVRLRLADGIVDIELDNEHFEAGYSHAVSTYRQYSANAYEESYMLLTVQQHVNSYILPDEVTAVRQAFRRTIGIETGPGATSFDPFSSAVINTYLLNHNHSGGLATYELYSGYLELAARMFGGHVVYTFNPSTKEIKFVRNFKGSGEQILLWTDNLKPEIMLLKDVFITNWITSWTLAQCKMIIGEAREKFSSIAGPGGGTTLNGTAMKSEAATMMMELMKDLKNYGTGGPVLTWVIG